MSLPGNPDRPAPAPSPERWEVTEEIPRDACRSVRQPDRPVLRVVAGRDLLHFVELPPDVPVIIGRDETVDLPLEDVSVSRRHARLEPGPAGEFVVVDLGSTNGTAVNGRPVERSVLKPGDHLEVGAVSLRLDLLAQDEVEHLRRVRSRLRMAENRDPLTGLSTRAFLEDGLPSLAAVCERAGMPLACVFVDLDHFKRINDDNGHAVGDEVLRTVARLAMLDCRDTDHCVRYGGEEFLFILQETNADGAVLKADRFRRAVRGHDWSRTAPGLQVSISCGVAVRRMNEDLGAWIGRADRAMYMAKRGGRNQVVRAPAD